MMILISPRQRDAELKANGFKETQFAEDGIEVWENNGKFYIPPPAHEDGDGAQYCPLGLMLFLKRVSGGKGAIELKGHSSIDYVASPSK